MATTATTGRGRRWRRHLFGGAGDDIITDLGGDDNLQGQDGNDAIHGGNGINLILGGFGNDFIVTGEDESEAFGGPATTSSWASRGRVRVRQRRRRLDRGGMADGAPARTSMPSGSTGSSATTSSWATPLADRMDGEGGDDIMVGNGGDSDRYEGFSGFDWAVFKDDPRGFTPT